MNLTPGQLREALALSQDTFRHWKQTLEPLRGRNGYRPCFTPGDLLAVAVVQMLHVEAGVAVGALQGIAQPLFSLCARSAWAELERCHLVIEVGSGRVTAIRNGHISRAGETVTVHVALASLITKLRSRLLADGTTHQQQSLRFPLVAVRGPRRTAGRGRA